MTFSYVFFGIDGSIRTYYKLLLWWIKMTNIEEMSYNHYYFNALHLKLMEFFFFVLNPSRLQYNTCYQECQQTKTWIFLIPDN